jgi:hypothetical protein
MKDRLAEVLKGYLAAPILTDEQVHFKGRGVPDIAGDARASSPKGSNSYTATHVLLQSSESGENYDPTEKTWQFACACALLLVGH